MWWTLLDFAASNITAAERHKTLEDVQVKLNHADGCLG
jgi:hypothetical protein